MSALRGMGWVPLALVCLSLMPSATVAQDPPPLGSGTLYLVADPATIGATVPCDSVAYSMSEEAPVEAKAYTARSFGGSACTSRLDFEVPRAFAATTPITIRAVMACDAAAASAGVEGATASMRFIVDHDGEAVTGNINLVGPTECGTTPMVFQAEADLDGEEFAAGDILSVRVIPFYTTGGAGDPHRNLHFKAGGADPTIVHVPDLAVEGGGPPGLLYQDVTTPTLRVGRNETTNLTETAVFNWTGQGPVRFSSTANVTSGEVQVLVTNATNATLLEQRINVTGQVARTLEGGGNLTLRVDYVNFTGSLVLELAPGAGGSSATSSSTRAPGTSQTVTEDGDRTGTFPLVEEKDTPMPGAVPVGLAIAAAAFAFIRRRLD